MRRFGFAAHVAAPIALAIVFVSPKVASSAPFDVVRARNSIEMQQRGNSVPPIVGPDRGRENPNCRIIRLRDGSALTYRGTTVTVGGTCPAGYFRGSIVDKWTFRVQANGELRTCRMNEHMQFWC